MTMVSIKQRPDGKWRARYRDDAGKEHARHFALKRDAQRWLDEVTTAVVTGAYVDPKAGSLTWDAFTESWMNDQVWVQGTLDAAETAVSSVPWRDKQLKAINHAQVKGWIAAEQKRGLAASTIATRLSYVQMAFRYAVKTKRISESPAVDVKAPRQRRAESAMVILPAESIPAVLEHAGDFRMFIEVCLFAGLRLGEAAGLQLGDVDFMRRSIHVARQIQGATHKTAKPVPPKAGSERTIFIPDELALRLSAYVAALKITGPEEYLFLTPLNKLYQRNNAGAEFRRVRTEAKLPDDVTLHTLRHTYASNLIASGCDVVTVQRALGHATPSITLNVYSHLWPSAEDKTRAATASFMETVKGLSDAETLPA